MAKEKSKNFRQTSLFMRNARQPLVYRSLDDLIYLIESNRIDRISLDIETTPIKPYIGALDPWKGKIRLLGIYSKAGAFFADLFVTDNAIVQKLIDLLDSKQIEVIAHHACFEGAWFQYWYNRTLNWRCTLVLHRVANAGKKLPADLNSVGRYYKVIDESESDEKKKELQSSSFGGLISDEQIEYVISDAKKAWDIYHEGLRQFPWPRESYYWECNNIPIFVEMILTGLPVDEELAKKILQDSESSLKDIERKLGYNPGSRLVLRKIFEEKGFIPSEKGLNIVRNNTDLSLLDAVDRSFLGVEFDNDGDFYDSEADQEFVDGIEAERINKRKIQSFDDNVLLIAESKFPDLCDWRSIRAYRRIQWNAAYVKGILDHTYLGRVRPKIIPIAKSGYRVSVNDPNLANSIKDSDLLRSYKVLPGRIIFAEKGMLSTDGPAAHLRVMSQLSRDPAVKKAIEIGDFHSQTAASIAARKGLDWSFDYIRTTKDDKKDPNCAKVSELRAGAKEFIYLWLNGGKAIKAEVTLATGQAKYRFKPGEAQLWIDATDSSFACASALKSLLSDGPVLGKAKRKALLKARYGIDADKYEKQLSMVVDDNHILNVLGKYTYLKDLEYNARIIAPWMSGERVWMLTSCQRVYQIRKKIGYRFSSWQHDEFIGRSLDPSNSYEVAKQIENICVDTSRELVGFTKFYKDGDETNPVKDKKGRFLGDFSAIKMQISNLTEK